MFRKKLLCLKTKKINPDGFQAYQPVFGCISLIKSGLYASLKQPLNSPPTSPSPLQPAIPKEVFAAEDFERDFESGGEVEILVDERRELIFCSILINK
jgi:hypothetical protein